MRFRIVLALSLSVILVGIASWTRFFGTNPSEAGLLTVEKAEEYNEYYDELVKNYPSISSSTPSALAENLTGTDLISRQMIVDYVSLSTSGQANSKSIDGLAERYIESIPTLISPEAVAYADIKVVTVSTATLKKYSDQLVKIQLEYGQKGSQLDSGTRGTNGFTPEYYKFAATTALIYRETASQLTAMEVPTVLAQNHMELINAYLSNATAMKAVSKMAEDPATGFAGLIMLGEGINNEQMFLEKIGAILLSYGV